MCNAADNQNVVGLDGLTVATVDKSQTVHQVVTRGKEPAVSLHVYSRPIDSCVAYDLQRGVCYRREMTYHSEYGQVILRAGDLTPPAATPRPGRESVSPGPGRALRSR